MADEISKLSPEQVNKLARTINEAKSLTNRQAEIIAQVIKGETDIGEIRISYLRDYFDTYSEILDKIARRQSELSDAFLILDRKSAENYQPSPSGNNDGGGSQPPNNNGAANNSGAANSGGGKAASHDASQSEQLSAADTSSAATAEEIEKAKQLHIKSLKSIDAIAAFYQNNREERENEIKERLEAANNAFEQRRQNLRVEQEEEIADKVKSIHTAILDLENSRHRDEIDKENALTELRLERVQKALKAETDAQNAINALQDEIEFSGAHSQEAGELRARESHAKSIAAATQELEEKRLNYIAKKELEAKRKNNGVLSKEDAAKIQKDAAEKFKLDEKNLEKLAAKKTLLDAAHAAKDERKNLRDLTNQALKGETTTERYEALKKLTTNEAGDFDLKKSMTAAVLAVSDLAKQLESKIDSIAEFKGFIDTRLQGSSNEKYAGSYWDQLVHDMTSVGAITPYFKQETFAANIKTLVEKGIAFDLEQRAFLMTIQEKIAKTFNVADGTLLRLIRIQQEDTTAGRLGMESTLNAFLNNMYETSEYLSDVASSVRSSLQEMESLMTGTAATEVEFQVQKWLGSLYSVGMSQEAVTSISNAIGQLAAGQIEGLISGGASNLLVMAANDAGIPVADILTRGLDADDTNELLQAAVNYLAELAESSKDNNVVQQQLANVFGVKASDLRAATNLSTNNTIENIYGSNLTYDKMLTRLGDMAGSMHERASLGEMMTNIWQNTQYSIAGSMASNPISYFIYKAASLLDSAAGGIDLPFVNVMGFGVDLNTTISDLMRVAAVSTGIIGSIGEMASGLGNSFSGRAMLEEMGISSGSGLSITPRGDGSILGKLTGGGKKTTSGSGYVGNASGSDVKNSTIQEAEDSKEQLMVEAQEEAETNQITVLNTTVVKIYELLDDVVHGNSSVKVKVEGYGLTTAGANSTALGGVAALGDSGTSVGGTSGGGTSGVNSSGIGSNGVSGSINLGGWTTT